MDRVTPGLYVGSLADAGDRAALHSAGVEVVVRLTHGSASGTEPGVTVHAHPMVDGPRNDAEAFARVAGSRDEADPHPALVRRAAAFVEREIGDAGAGDADGGPTRF